MLARRIVIDKTGSRSTVVWTPWHKKADRMGDLGPDDGWRRMLCVKSGNALDSVVSIRRERRIPWRWTTTPRHSEDQHPRQSCLSGQASVCPRSIYCVGRGSDSFQRV